jgi:hypothetical protein
MTYIVGWVDIETGTKVPLRFVTYLSKVTKINEKSGGGGVGVDIIRGAALLSELELHCRTFRYRYLFSGHHL